MGVWKILDVNDVLHYYADNFNHLATSITASFLVAFVLLLLHGEVREEAANHLLPAYGLVRDKWSIFISFLKSLQQESPSRLWYITG